MAAVDVAIVGGGLQGLVVLRQLTAAGYGCALVTHGDLGSGQTLHSHGLLNSGTGLLTGALQPELNGLTVPYLARLGVGFGGHDGAFLLLPDEVVDQLAPVWDAHGYRPAAVDRSALPAGFQPATPSYRVPAVTVDKRRLVASLVAGLESLVVKAEVVDAADGVHIRGAASGETRSLEPRAVVVAAGCGTKRLLRERFGVAEDPLARISYTKPHMICLRGPSAVLPAVDAVVAPDVMVVGHRTDDDLVTWYVTPGKAAPVRHGEAPDDGAAPVEPPVVAAGLEALVRLFPPLVDGGAGIEATVFAGYKQDFDGQPTRRACELVDPERNLVMVLPSVLANAVPNAVDAVEIVRERLGAPGPEPATPWGGGVGVGGLNEDSPGTVWLPWRDFARASGLGER